MSTEKELMARKSDSAGYIDTHPQETFNDYVEMRAWHLGCDVEKVLKEKIVIEYGKDLGVTYTGNGIEYQTQDTEN